MTNMVDVPEVSFTSRVATMASMASIAMSYQPGLLPRSVGDQAILTGLTSAVNYGLVAVTGSALEGAATSVVGVERMQKPGVAAAAHGVANAALVAGSVALRRLLPPREGEPLRRATLRSAGWVGAGYDGVHVFAPEDGARIAQIHLPEICSNVCFGGTKRNRLFMTGSQSLYAVYVNTKGAHFC